MKRRLILIVLFTGLALAGGWWAISRSSTRAAVATMLPSLPDLSTAPVGMREQIVAADARARSLTRAKQGFGELAQLYHANGFLDEAMKAYDGLEHIEPTVARWPHLHATILSGFGETEPAVTLWKRAITLGPDYVPARLRLGDCLLKAGRSREAADVYSAVLKLEPSQPYAIFGLARVDFEAGRLEPAREKLEKLVSQTNYQLGYDLIVTVYERLGLRDQASAVRGLAAASGAYRDPADPWLDSLIAYCFDPYRLSLNAGVAARLGDNKAAQQLLERAIELTPDDVALRFQLGMLAVQQGDTTLAADQLQRCTMLSPEFADAWAHLSALQASKGDTAAAERTLATGLRNSPQSPGLHLMKARNLRNAGRLEDAANEYSISARLRPNEADAYIELGSTLIAMDRVADGVEQLKAALAAEPANPTALAILAFHAITTGNESDARHWLVRVGNQPRSSKESRDGLAAAYLRQFGKPWQWSAEN